MRMDNWLAQTRYLQAQHFGGDPSLLPMHDRVDFIRRMVLGLIKEATEVLDEVPGWKWWHAPDAKFDREAYLTELVDVVHFVGALAVAADCTDEEWARLYTAKTQIVRERATGGAR